MLPQVYELPQCAGRPATFKDPFGDFLFLVRDPKDTEFCSIDPRIRHTSARFSVKKPVESTDVGKSKDVRTSWYAKMTNPGIS